MSDAKRNGKDWAFANVMQSGLTKREYFAGLTMQGIIASPSYDSRYFQDNVKEAVSYADALLEALEATNE